MKKEPKHPHPKDMGNGEFSSTGGLEVYKLLWGLQGRLGRVEGVQVLQGVLTGVILAKIFGAI